METPDQRKKKKGARGPCAHGDGHMTNKRYYPGKAGIFLLETWQSEGVKRLQARVASLEAALEGVLRDAALAPTARLVLAQAPAQCLDYVRAEALEGAVELITENFSDPTLYTAAEAQDILRDAASWARQAHTGEEG